MKVFLTSLFLIFASLTSQASALTIVDPLAVCETAVIKYPQPNMNFIAVRYIDDKVTGMRAKEVRRLCMGDRNDGKEGKDDK